MPVTFLDGAHVHYLFTIIFHYTNRALTIGYTVLTVYLCFSWSHVFQGHSLPHSSGSHYVLHDQE